MAEYIERKALEKALTIAAANGKDKDRRTWAKAICVLHDMPTADVAPVVHGRWDGNDCTVCKLPWNYNMTQDADDWGYFDPMPDYCPNCGARMDGGVRECD